MTYDRLRYIWKVLYSMYRMDEYGHMFKHGASIDTMYMYVAEWCGRIGFTSISKSEIKFTLKHACNAGWATKISRSYIGFKLPSAYKFK